MTARYQVIIADPILEDPEIWAKAEGLALVSVDGPWAPADGSPSHGAKLCTIEDDGAPPELDGKLVDLTLTRDISGPDPRVLVDTRVVIN